MILLDSGQVNVSDSKFPETWDKMAPDQVLYNYLAISVINVLNQMSGHYFSVSFEKSCLLFLIIKPI
jgi:hypothetical protein